MKNGKKLREIAALGRDESDESSKRLVAIFCSLVDGPEVCIFEVCRWLGTRRKHIVEAALIQALRNDKDGPRLRGAAYATGIYRSRRAAPHLRSLVCRTSLSPRTRGYAAEALAHLPSRRTAKVLEAQLDDESPEVRYWSIFALAEIGETKVIPKLMRLVKDDHRIGHGVHKVSEEAEWAIRRLKRRKQKRTVYPGGVTTS